jgi:hypothetical protein
MFLVTMETITSRLVQVSHSIQLLQVGVNRPLMGLYLKEEYSILQPYVRTLRRFLRNIITKHTYIN